MTIPVIRFNKTTLSGLVRKGASCVIKDSEERGLRFKVGSKRSVFQFEKRISGRKGSPVTFTIGAFPAVSIEDARQEARRLCSLCEKGVDPRKKSRHVGDEALTLEVGFEKFLAVKPHLSESYLRSMRTALKLDIPASWLRLDMNQITPQMIAEQFMRTFRRSQRQAQICLKLLINVWNTCMLHFMDGNGCPLLLQNPAAAARNLLKDVKFRAPCRAVIREPDIGRFVATLEDLLDGKLLLADRPLFHGARMLYEIALLTLFTGLRFTEARCLRWEYIDLEAGVIRLPGTVATPAGGFRGTKNKKDHFVALSTYPWAQLKLIYAERGQFNPLVFPSATNPNAPFERSDEACDYLRDLLGFYYSPHASRRTFASIADEIGLGFLTLKRLLNHSFQGGVTGGYIVKDFNPARQRVHFQKICDFILEKKAVFLGQEPTTELDPTGLVAEVKRFILAKGNHDPSFIVQALIQEFQVSQPAEL